MESKKDREEQERLTQKEIMDVMMNFLYAVPRVRSIRRAMKRGRLTQYGILIAKRPFNNRANTSSRKGKNSRFVNEIKKRDYELAKRKAA